MKAEHEADRTFDRISTREELCEVIDLLCDTGKTSGAGVGPMRRRKGSDTISSQLLSGDLAFDLNLNDLDEEDGDKSSEDEGTDELSETLTDLFASPANWLN